jgi:hypothetical protein
MLLLMGCGGSATGSGGGSGAFNSGLPSSEQLGDLSDADAQELCASALSSDAAKVTFNVFCRVTAITEALSLDTNQTDATLQATCQMLESQCTSTIASETASTSMMCHKSDTPCAATVADYTTCIDDDGAAASAELADIPECASLTAASANAVSENVLTSAQPASCQALGQECPGFMLGGTAM